MSGFKNKITGAFDLLFLFGRGIKNFSGTREDALKSIAIPAALLPFSLAFGYFYPPKGMESGYGYGQIAATMGTQSVLEFILASVLVLWMSRLLGRGEKFWLFFQVSNWVSLAFFIATIPFMIMAVTGIVAREEMDRLFVIVSAYSYIVTACIAWRAFTINWQLAGFISIVMLFVGQELLHLLYRVQGIPIPW